MTAASWRTIHTNGIRMAVSEQGAGLPVVLCHGFPEIAYSWRHQLPAVAAAGFRAIAPDQRGYGETDRPAAVSDYDIHQLTADLVGLLDALGLERAVFAGHDWGGIVVWHMPLLHPARTAGVIGVNTPYFPRSSAPPVTLMRALWGDDYYIVHFQKPGEADAALARDVRRVFTQLVRSGVPLAGTRTPRPGRNLHLGVVSHALEHGERTPRHLGEPSADLEHGDRVAIAPHHADGHAGAREDRAPAIGV